jgi:hypothetical protein
LTVFLTAQVHSSLRCVVMLSDLLPVLWTRS